MTKSESQTNASFYRLICASEPHERTFHGMTGSDLKAAESAFALSQGDERSEHHPTGFRRRINAVRDVSLLHPCVHERIDSRMRVLERGADARAAQHAHLEMKSDKSVKVSLSHSARREELQDKQFPRRPGAFAGGYWGSGAPH